MYFIFEGEVAEKKKASPQSLLGSYVKINSTNKEPVPPHNACTPQPALYSN
jgi:hypothetical protein